MDAETVRKQEQERIADWLYKQAALSDHAGKFTDATGWRRAGRAIEAGEHR